MKIVRYTSIVYSLNISSLLIRVRSVILSVQICRKREPSKQTSNFQYDRLVAFRSLNEDRLTKKIV